MACCHLLLVRCRRLQRSAKCKYTHYRSTYCLCRRHSVGLWSRILVPNWREITGVDCIWLALVGELWNVFCEYRIIERFHGIITVFPLTHNRCEVVISWWSPLLPKISIYATKCESILEKSGILIHLQSKYCINLSCKKNLTISWVKIAARW